MALELAKELKYDINRVYAGGGALYLNSNNWMFMDLKLRTHNLGTIYEHISQLNKLNQFCKQNNIKFYVLLVPYKSAVYHEILEESYTYNVEEIYCFANYVELLRQKTGIPIIYPYEELRKASHEDFVFFKQAHHWTDWGAYQGYLALMKEISRGFPDIKTVTLEDYNKVSSKLIRDDWDRDFQTGYTTRLLGFKPKFAEKHLLLDDYIYYDHKSGNSLMVKKTDNMKFYSQKEGMYKILLTGDSQNENLLQFMPYSALQLKYIRLNKGILPRLERAKFLKYYRKEVIDFKPDILIYCISSEYSENILRNLTTN